MPAEAFAGTVGGWVDPGAAYQRLFADADESFWLDAGEDAARGFSHVGCSSGAVSAVVLSAEDAGAGSGATEVVEALRSGTAGETRWPGWVGWFGYEYGAAAMGVPHAAGDQPQAAWLRADRVVSFDHEAREVTVRAFGPGARRWGEAVTAAMRERQASAPPAQAENQASPPGNHSAPSAAPVASSPSWRHSDEEYLALLARCHDAIRRGDAYQLCLTNGARISGRFDPFRTYLRLRGSTGAAHGGLIRFGDWSLLSASPETFLEVEPGGGILTRPIKGTRPRGRDTAEDARLRAELAADPKERAENLMIVDLMRNDLARVAGLGTVAVTRLFDVESYPRVHQLVSEVRGRLRRGCDALDAVAACFPAGSMTGTPKRAAMRLLHELERGPRGVYAGCFGVLGGDGSAELAMVIRSIVVGADHATVGAGGGVTALSVPERELAEVALKAQALLAALDEAPRVDTP